MRLTNLALLGVGVGLSLGACRGGDPALPDGPPADSGPREVRIQDLQGSDVKKGDAVVLRNVVVTAVDRFGSRLSDLYVEEQGGGAFSGVKVFGAEVDQISTLVPGDLVDITGGVKDEFAIKGDDSGRTVTELKPAAKGAMKIQRIGTGTIPAPTIVDAAAVSAMDKTAREAEWEKWEGVLITVVNARQIAAQSTFGAGAEDQTEFRISGVARIQSSLAKLPTENAAGVCYDRITGIGDYAFNDLIIPRSTEDVVLGGTGCRPMAANVVEAQTKVNPEFVNLVDVFVTARDAVGTSRGIWVADSLVAAANNGIYVFVGNSINDNWTVGAKVSVQGLLVEFDTAMSGQPTGDTVTEVSGGTPVFVAAPGATPPTPVVVAASELSDIGAPGEAYEGVLVRANMMKVTNNALPDGKIELTDNGMSKLVVSSEIFTAPFPAQTNGACVDVVGVMHLDLEHNVRMLLPRAATDITTGTGCN
jgi:hypothetical protein